MLADALCLTLINTETYKLISFIAVVEQLQISSQNDVLSNLLISNLRKVGVSGEVDTFQMS